MRISRTGVLSGIKIKTRPQLKRTIDYLKRQGKRVVFTNGCFDLLHAGHVEYLERARQKGDLLVVGINSDTSVRRIKGKKRPIVNQLDRARVIAGLESVNFVVLFAEETPYEIIKLIRPDVLVKGADWGKKDIVGGDIVSSYGGVVSTVALRKGRSTTNLIKKIAKLY